MALATLRIGRLPNISKPALATIMPSLSSVANTLLLALGAVTDCTPKNLYEFAIMGEVYARKVLGLRRPSVGLLANGEEDSKGNALTKEALHVDEGKCCGFKGNVEGNDIFNGSMLMLLC